MWRFVATESIRLFTLTLRKMHFGPFIVTLKECTYGRMHVHCIKIAIERKQPTEAEKECNSCAKIRGGSLAGSNG